MQVIAFVNQKGGVGKTTSCLNVGAGLSRKGKRVLLIDTDPQGNLTISTGIHLKDGEPTVHEVLKGSTNINDAIKPGAYDVLPAANSVIVPVQAHYLALNGIAQLRDTISLVRKRMNPQLNIGGVIVTQYDNRRLIDKEVLESLTAAFPGKVFETTVSNSVALVEAPSFGKDIFEYKPNSKPAAQYEAIVNEIMKRS